MKNKRIEAKSKAYKSKQHGNVMIYHVYSEPFKDKTWWDDFSVKVNGKTYDVCWIHPRMKYSDEVEHQYYLQDKYSNDDMTASANSILSSSTPNYKKVGKSRKKISSWRLNFTEEQLERIDQQRTSLEEMKKTSDVVVNPSINIFYWNHRRGIEICYPVELRNESDIIRFCNEVIIPYIKTRKIDIDQNYKYDSSDWISEGNV